MASHSARRHALDTKQRDIIGWLVAAAAAVLSIIAYVVVDKIHGVLLYLDAMAHLEISHRVVDSTSPGIAQLGDVWLPLQHLIMLPFIWNNTLYQSGFAGSIVSMTAYAVTVTMIYKIVFGLTSSRVGGVIGALAFAINVNMLYMQSTPMTESLLYCTLAIAVYCIQQWADTGRHQYLINGGAAALAATLTRYESWVITGCLALSVALISWRQRPVGLSAKVNIARTGDRLAAFCLLAGIGVVGWVAWNWAIFGNPLEFQNGQFAKPALWRSANDPDMGHWLVAIKTYGYAVLDNETWPLILAATAGLVILVVLGIRSKQTIVRALPALSLLIVMPFYIVALYTGQRPLHVPQVNGNVYNVRFGLTMLPPTAILAGYLAGTLAKVRRIAAYALGLAIVSAIGVVGGMLVTSHNVVTYNEGYKITHSPHTIVEQDVYKFLSAHYKGGKILMESFGNEDIAFHVPSQELVYEGSYRQWLPALQYPAAHHIQWIVETCDPANEPNESCAFLGTAQLKPYQLVFRTRQYDYRVYELKKGGDS